MGTTTGTREGNLEAPTRHALDWRSAGFLDQDLLDKELERVYDICHGCRRCVSLCNAFPTLFDLVDESDTMEVDGVAKSDYNKVVEQCYLCDLCYQVKCPYVPPHEWNVDFPHLMLRAKYANFVKNGAKFRDRLLSNTDTVGRLAGIPIVNGIVNAANNNAGLRALLSRTLGVHADAPVPTYHRQTFRDRPADDTKPPSIRATDRTTGRVAIFATCYCNYNAPSLGEDLVAVLQHNDIEVSLAPKEQCCGMPKLELGDLESVARARDANIPVLAKLVDDGWDIVAAVPSCVLMFKQELPLIFPDDPDVAKVRDAIFDPFEYLMLRKKANLLHTDFRNPLGKVAWHVPCHQRVQKIGMKTRDILQLIPDTEVEAIERCSGHDGTYAVKNEFHDAAIKIARPVATRVRKAGADHFGSDCPMAGTLISQVLGDGRQAEHPLTLLRLAYGI